jgi:hypothetical protein
MDPNIADFIRANRRTYTREAITQQLLDAGYDRAAIDATFAALEAPDPDQTAGEGFWGRFFLILVGINVAVLLLVGLGTGALFSPERILLLGVLAVVLAIFALIAWGIVAATGPTKMGRTTATVIGVVIPLAFALMVGGACYALVGAIGPPPRTGTLEIQVEAPGNISGSGTATCYVGQSGGGFSVFGQRDGTPYVSVSIDTFSPEGGPGTGEVRNVSISIEPGSANDPGRMYGNFGGGGELESDVRRDGLEGTVTFSNLGVDTFEPTEGPDPDPISGSVSWNCE